MFSLSPQVQLNHERCDEAFALPSHCPLRPIFHDAVTEVSTLLPKRHSLRTEVRCEVVSLTIVVCPLLLCCRRTISCDMRLVSAFKLALLLFYRLFVVLWLLFLSATEPSIHFISVSFPVRFAIPFFSLEHKILKQ